MPSFSSRSGFCSAWGPDCTFSVPEVTRVNKVSVRGMTNITEKEITDALLLTPEINLVNADIPAMESRILANPKVAAVNVSRSFPDKLVVDLTERKAVACVLVNEEIGTRSIAIDEEGVAFAYMDSIAPTSKLPVLSGIRFEHFTPARGCRVSQAAPWRYRRTLQGGSLAARGIFRDKDRKDFRFRSGASSVPFREIGSYTDAGQTHEGEPGIGLAGSGYPFRQARRGEDRRDRFPHRYHRL